MENPRSLSNAAFPQPALSTIPKEDGVLPSSPYEARLDVAVPGIDAYIADNTGEPSTIGLAVASASISWMSPGVNQITLYRDATPHQILYERGLMVAQLAKTSVFFNVMCNHSLLPLPTDLICLIAMFLGRHLFSVLPHLSHY